MYGQAARTLNSLGIEELLDRAPVMRASDLAAQRADPITSGAIKAPEELASLFPSGIPLGGLASIGGNEGCGLATLCYRILAAGTNAGGYVALLDPARSAMPLAVLEAGIVPDRFVLVRAKDSAPSTENLARALGALLDGFSLIGVLDPHLLSAGLWKRVAGRARERHMLAIMAGAASGQEAASFRIDLSHPIWETGPDGLLKARTVHARVSGIGHPREERISLTCGGESG